MKKTLKKLAYKARLLLAAVLLLGIQTLAPASAFLPEVSAAPICVVDTAGANDEPGQKDLNQMCADYAGVPNTVETTWNWDETGTSGANTMDACNLFDNDGNGNIDYAVCVTTTGDPAVEQTTTTYSCGDDKIDRCTSPATPIGSGTTDCEVNQVTNDPFPGPPNSAKGDDYPNDTEGSCEVDLSTVGGSSAVLVDVCSYPSAQPNSDPSDCVIARNDFGKVELKKDIVPNSDTGLFNLTINGPEASDTTTVNNIGDNGTTGEQVVKKGSVVVSETAGTNTSLTNYNTTIVCKDLNGTGNTLALSNTDLTGTTRQATFTLVEDADVVCTITNDRQESTLILQKTVVNDNGGALTQSNFPVAIGGNAAAWGPNTVSPGSYVVSETQQPGYTAGAWGGDCDAQGNVTLTDGQTKTCTITNDDQAPSLTLNKIVSNTHGGTADESDWTLTADGPTDLTGPGAAGSADVVSGPTFSAGTYTLSESTGPSGYTASLWTCTNGVTVTSGQITLALGQTTVCSITNSDIVAQLTVVKHVVNDDGGQSLASAFTMNVTATNPSDASFPGDESGTTIDLDAGSYSVDETGPSGYAASFSADCSGSITVGQSKTCTVTNNDIAPVLTVIKTVVNDDGGLLDVSDFNLYVDGNQVTSGVPNVLDAGDYVVSEDEVDGYTAGSWGGDCDAQGNVTLLIGGTYECTITNDDQAGTLIVRKVVVNDNGGTKEAGDFGFSVNGGGVVPFEADAQNNITVNAGTYDVTEPAVTGYTTTYDNCEDVVVSNGETETCTVTNNDVQPKLTVTKVVTNDNGGDAVVADFPLFVDATGVTSGVENGFDAGSYVVSETEQTGYTAAISGDCDAQGNVTLEVGDVKSCTITNDDEAPKLTLVKYVVNDNGGDAVVSDFPLFVNGNPVTSGQSNTLSANTLYTASETNQPGYTAGTWGGDCNTDGTITLEAGDDKTCTITNDDVAPTVTLIKSVTNDNGGTAGANDFGLTVGGSATNSGDVNNVDANTPIALNEAGLSGYAFVSITGDNKCPDVLGGTVTLDEGENVTCTITNDDIPASLTLIKYVLNDNGGSLGIGDFPLFVDGNSVTSGVPTLINAGSHTASETNQPGYTAGTWGGDCNADGTINAMLGGQYTCTITNDDQAATIKVTKVVVNDNGGTAVADDFTLKVNDTTVNSGDTNEFDGNASYTISEEGLSKGYEQTDLACVDITDDVTVSNPFEAELGHDYECTITNDDIGPKLKIVKKAYPEGPQDFSFTSEELGDFTLDDDDDATLENNKQFEDLQAGVYDVAELPVNNWELKAVYCDEGADFKVEEDGTLLVSLEVGDDVTCYFVNEEKNTVSGHKFNDINGNHVWDENEPGLAGWTITITSECEPEEEVILLLDNTWRDEQPEECVPINESTVTDTNGAYSFDELEPGTYTVCETQKANWTQTFPETEDGCHVVEIEGPGQTVAADFGNKAKPQVLGELIKTGNSANKSVIAGLLILSALVGLHFVTRRRKEYAK